MALAIASLSCAGREAGVEVTITPSYAEVVRLSTQPFDASVRGTLTSDVTWSIVRGAGTLDSLGNYTAPANIPPDEENEIVVRASAVVDPSAFAEATVRVVRPPIEPDFGPTKGGTILRIVLPGVRGGQTEVFFDGEPAASVEVVSGAILRVTTPPSAALAPADVRIRVAGEDLAVWPDAFRYGATQVRYPGGWRLPEVCGSPDPAMAAFDLDGDGLDELLVECSGVLDIRSADGYGGYGRPIRQLMPFSRVHQFRAGDLEGDGDGDVFAVIRSGFFGFLDKTMVFRNDGDSFEELSELKHGFGMSDRDRIAVADLDGDGAAEILRTCPDGLALHANAGDGTFLPATLVPVGGGTTDVAAVDLEPDGDPDLVAATPAGFLVILNPSGSFPVAATTTAERIAVLDLDADGLLDVVTASASETHWVPGRIPSGAAPEFDAAIPLVELPAGVRELLVADVDGDGRDDLVAWTGGGVVVVPSASSGPGAPIAFPSDPLMPSLVAARVQPGAAASVGALDGQGALRLRPADAAGGFGVPELPATTSTGRLFCDGDCLLVRQTPAEACLVRAGATPSGLARGACQVIPAGMNGFSAGDVDGDGQVDFILSSTDTGVGGWLRRDGDALGPFVDLFYVPGSLIGLAVADLDRDGRADLVIAQSVIDPDPELTAVSIAWGSGAGAFSTPVSAVDVVVASAVRIADLDGDGAPELVAAALLEQAVFVVSIAADREITLQAAVPVDLFPLSLALEDLDADGFLDIAVSGVRALISSEPERHLQLLRNGFYGLEPSSPVDIGTYGPLVLPDSTGLFVRDLDGNGTPDLALLVEDGSGGSILAWLPGHGDGTLGELEQLDLGRVDPPPKAQVLLPGPVPDILAVSATGIQRLRSLAR